VKTYKEMARPVVEPRNSETGMMCMYNLELEREEAIVNFMSVFFGFLTVWVT
jgi:hypothetical protein